MTPLEDPSEGRPETTERRLDTRRTLVADGGRRPDAAEGDDRPIVLVVDDDEAFAETVKIWLEPEMSVRTVFDGEQAVDAYEPDVDVVLLDRKMPMMSGDEALKRIRAREGNPGMAVMTAMSPNEKVVAMDFDTYLQKPVMRDELTETIETLLERIQYPDEVRRLFSIRSKLTAFRETHSENQLAESDPYQRLVSEFDRLSEEAAREIAELDSEEADRLEGITEPTR